eukprot:CAMPEP_0118947112 /NCGR_PEP_ID=MMETSP1169-20130426/45400_1 /TAXON_ID=36882 /ORGANISM="Pyramimonas obovata, Strain CCMP722" /LENGTH=215 /DNA_ID=CAMNT_0006893261 /DNA_START=56 /DNA_END=703 /DNA_ORIENTATION=+
MLRGERGGEGFHLIVVDPPWENASARRGSKYATVPARNLVQIPMCQLYHPQGTLVAMWMTNRERLLRFAEEELLEAWGLRPVATWYWLKVTDGGDPVTPFDAPNRRPYERLLLAVPAVSAQSDPAASALTGASGAGATLQVFHTEERVPPPPESFVLIAAPGEHSRKPKLKRVLQQYLPQSARCLELFAREATSGWTAWGNQCLKFQHSAYFKKA